MENIWILVANASEAKLYQTPKIHAEWKLLEEFSHPESREKVSDIMSDKMGDYQAFNLAHGSFVETTDPKEVEAERFAHILAQKLEHGRDTNQYKRLILMAPPHFYGLLNKTCHAKVLDLVWKHVDKDYTKLSIKELMDKFE